MWKGICVCVCVRLSLPPNPKNRHSSAEDLPTKFTKGYWGRPERTETLCTEWMWPWEVWEQRGLRNITKLLLGSPNGRKPFTFNMGAWGWLYVRSFAFDRPIQSLLTTHTWCGNSAIKHLQSFPISSVKGTICNTYESKCLVTTGPMLYILLSLN